jgi:hypothetical protein
MPWFPEFGIAQKMAAEGRAAAVTVDEVRSYVKSVHSGLSAFATDGIVVHDPRAGRVEGSPQPESASTSGARAAS